ncbi:MAG: prolipoprotein diacylglyceryl transferase [Acidobacteria bacterium]|nr:prolipoprotein diacylglyceryl transferase [Acidobacteriota bacterium]
MSAYWSLYVLAWGLSGLLFGLRARKAQVSAWAIADTLLLSLPLAIVGTHVVFGLSAPGNLGDWRHYFFTAAGWRSGHTSFGAVGGTLVAIWIAGAIHHLPLTRLADSAAPSIFVASAVMRTGCFLAGCCYGGPTETPWGVSFPTSNPLQPFTVPSHPSQLYEVAISLLILLVLPPLIRSFHLVTVSGGVTAFCLLLYFLERFVLEFFRIGGTSEILFLGLSTTQWGTMAAAGACGLLASMLRHRARPSGDFRFHQAQG